jgi:hypothetical protein
MDKTIISTTSELFIPANTLPYGIYQLTLTVSMIVDPSLTNSSSVYVQIGPSGITANLVPLGTSVVTSGHEQDLKLDPGNFSMDPDGYPFNTSVCYSFYSRLNLSFKLFFCYRIGSIHIFVEFMMMFQVQCYLSNHV